MVLMGTNSTLGMILSRRKHLVMVFGRNEVAIRNATTLCTSVQLGNYKSEGAFLCRWQRHNKIRGLKVDTGTDPDILKARRRFPEQVHRIRNGNPFPIGILSKEEHPKQTLVG